MRWDNLTVADEPTQDVLFGVSDVIPQTFDTPEFRGMTFYEVRARSILNKVPSTSRMPFQLDTQSLPRMQSFLCLLLCSADSRISRS
jgi:hypothetical protein